MDDETYRAAMAAVRRALDERGELATRLGEQRGAFDQLVEVLIGKQILAEGHRKVLARAAAATRSDEKPRVRLRVLVDKYAVPNSDIDCPSLLHLCHARCCSFGVQLTTQDLDEGVVRWDLATPYVMLRGDDGYCTHFDRPTSGCTVYDKRPATCRSFDCRDDTRVWLDWEKRIPAPLPPYTPMNQVVELDLGVVPDAAVSEARLSQDESEVTLSFSAMSLTPDGKRQDAGTATIKFEHCIITKFGYPNDEALSGHPLWGRGLRSYGCYEVLQSSWLDDINSRNRVAFPDFQGYPLRHFIFTFHDSTFECLAADLKLTLA